MTSKHRLYEIDLFRFFAAIAVVFYHYGFRGWMADDLSRVAAPGLAPLVQYGYLGVDLFFIISGFVILLTAGRGDPLLQAHPPAGDRGAATDPRVLVGKQRHEVGGLLRRRHGHARPTPRRRLRRGRRIESENALVLELEHP